MNWLGKLIQYELTSHDTVLDIGCGIMQATTDILHRKFGGRGNEGMLRCKKITGTDIHPPYLTEIRNRYKDIETLNLSVEDTCKIMGPGQFDIVLCLDVLEHLEQAAIPMVIDNMQRIAKKKVIVYTPSRFTTNEIHADDAWNMGPNDYQLHRSFIDPSFLESKGFKITFPAPDCNTLGIFTK